MLTRKKFELIEYTDADYAEEIERIQERFTPLVKICREYGTAMRIGTNHGSLSDRIMSRYGDTPMGMVESAMEFLRIARYESYHNIVLSMKSSNPRVMVQAYRLLVKTMQNEFGECYPLHLGVTEAGDGEDGRIKSAVGIGTLLEDGMGDTIRVSLTEDPELEIPVCRDLVKRYSKQAAIPSDNNPFPNLERLSLDYKRRSTISIGNIGGQHVPVVIADMSKLESISPKDLESVGYSYDVFTDKWSIGDTAADYVFTGHHLLPFALPGTLKTIVYPATWLLAEDKSSCLPIYEADHFLETFNKGHAISATNFVMLGAGNATTELIEQFNNPELADKVVLCLYSEEPPGMPLMRHLFELLEQKNILSPAVIIVDSSWQTPDEHLIHYATEAGALLLDGLGDGICLGMTAASYQLSGREKGEALSSSGRNYLQSQSVEQFINNTAFSILQATRTRISKTEYISCPSCGRTLFDLQETTARIRAVTHHLKGVKIAIMGCIVNGPGEMADADFGYVGSGPGRITLYKGKEVVKRNVPSEIAVEELVNLLKENDVWVEPQRLVPNI